MGLLRGFSAPFRGALFVARHRLWWYLALPLVINLGLSALATWLSVRLVRQKLGEELFATAPLLAWTVLVVFAGLLAILFFVLAQPLVGAPFVDVLTERTETIVRGRAPPMGLLRGAAQALLHGLLKALLYGVALMATLALGSVSGVGGVLGMALYALFLAFDGFDYALSRRAVSFGGKWRYLGLHPGQTLGYCFGASLLYLIPLAALVAPAFAAVGATLAFLDGDSTPAATPLPDGDSPGGTP